MSNLVESFSGVRGIFGEDIDEDFAKRYAFAYYNFLKNKIGREPKIVIGMDTRKSGKRLKESISSVMPNIIDLDIATTPMIQLGVREYKADGGIIITASHNEPEYNGFKFLWNDSALLRPSDMEKVIESRKNIILKEKETRKNIEKKHNEIIERYIEFILKILGKDIERIKKSGFKIVVDPNGGAAIVVIEELLKRLNVDIVGINMKEGEFNRLVEPKKESLSYLTEIIKKEKVDFAVGFDCDADRAEIMLENGNIVSGNYVLALILDELVKENETVVINDVVSGVARKIAEKHDAEIKEVEVGEINVVDEMEKTKAVLGGESSGVIVPPSKCRDGLLAFVMVLKIIAKKAKPLKEILEELPRYYTIEENYPIKKQTETRKKIKEVFSKKDYKITEKGGITGSLKIHIDDSFLWFRASKTESNLFRMIADSPNKEKAEQLIAEGKQVFEND